MHGRASVSIHAPARGATVVERIHWGLPPVSIHAPARGATFSVLFSRRQFLVSIHAPARGATSFAWRIFPPLTFQSTRPRGARLVCESFIRCPSLFQSTRPRGARLFRLICYLIRPVFQSTRPRGARRCLAFIASCFFRVSIHAPARGATIYC